jgi:hypothetical protein
MRQVRGAEREETTVADTQSDTVRAAQQRARYLTGLMWHIGAFVIINAAFWAMDAWIGDPGISWAYWITGFWGFALAFHALAYLVDGRQVERRKAAQYAAEERRLGASG